MGLCVQNFEQRCIEGGEDPKVTCMHRLGECNGGVLVLCVALRTAHSFGLPCCESHLCCSSTLATVRDIVVSKLAI